MYRGNSLQALECQTFSLVRRLCSRQRPFQKFKTFEKVFRRKESMLVFWPVTFFTPHFTEHPLFFQINRTIIRVLTRFAIHLRYAGYTGRACQQNATAAEPTAERGVAKLDRISLTGHVGIVAAVADDGKFKLIHARGVGKLSSENPYFIAASVYRPGSKFYGFYRPISENSNIETESDNNAVDANNTVNATDVIDATSNPYMQLAKMLIMFSKDNTSNQSHNQESTTAPQETDNIPIQENTTTPLE